MADISAGVESGFIYWTQKSINVKADADNVGAVTRAVNGGDHGLADRTSRLQKLKLIMGI